VFELPLERSSEVERRAEPAASRPAAQTASE
jgi:hypothetical protein